MSGHLRWLAVAGVAAVLAGCQQGPSRLAQARMDSLTRSSAQRDTLVQEMAYDARVLSEISTQLARVSVPKGKLHVTAETPMQASRDSLVQKVRYIASRLPEAERRLRQSEERVASLTAISDSLRSTLEATLANYREIVDSQKSQIGMLVALVDTLRGENVALKDTVANMSVRENTVYYVIGTKDELEQRGIVTEEGGSRFLFVLWRSGRTVTPARRLDPSLFTAINKREVTNIPLPDPNGSYRIASRQDLTALGTPSDDHGNVSGTGSLSIAHPEQFWKNSKFLIIVIG
jgi:hypothetical protein